MVNVMQNAIKLESPRSFADTIDVTIKLMPEWTHKLVIKFWKLPWANYDIVKNAVGSILVPTINAFEFFLGYDYLGYEIFWDKDIIEIYYSKRSFSLSRKSFIAIPPLAQILFAIALILIGAGIIIFAVAWYEHERSIAETRTSLRELYEKGLLTKEEYIELSKLLEEKKPAWWEEIPETIKYLIYGGIALGIISLIVSLVRK